MRRKRAKPKRARPDAGEPSIEDLSRAAMRRLRDEIKGNGAGATRAAVAVLKLRRDTSDPAAAAGPVRILWQEIQGVQLAPAVVVETLEPKPPAA